MEHEHNILEPNDERNGSRDERDPIYEDSGEDVNESEIKLGQYPTDSIERDILALFITKSPTSWSYTFSGIRRLLGTHQQTLSNALDRMIEDSILVKDKSGYQLNDKSKNFQLTADYGPETVKDPRKWLLVTENEDTGREKVWIGTTPNFIPVAPVARKLAGRWFDSFRFTGSYINSRKNQATLEWVNVLDVSMQMIVEITQDQLMIELKDMSPVMADTCLDFIQSALSKQGIMLYFELDDTREYNHGRNYNN